MSRKPILLLALTTIALALLSCSNQPDRNFERKQNFDFNWKFFLGDFPDASGIDFDDNNWRSLDLPHDWSIEGDVDTDNPSGNDGGYYPTGIGWYRKSFSVPSEWKDKKISIYFEGIYMNAEVFINGKSLGTRPYGYASFSYDLTPNLLFAEENTISVRVDNSQQKNSRWYSGSGIYRHVWLIVTERIHIKHWGVGITTPQVSPEVAVVRINTMIENNTNAPRKIILSTKVTDFKEGNRTIGTPVLLEPNSEKLVHQELSIEHPSLWTPDKPNLFHADIEIIQDNYIIDRTTETFGIRTIEFNADKGFLLNGQPVIINGGCVHHDNGSLGAAAYDRAEERKAELLKSAGFNAVRTAHNLPSESFLDACDRVGLLVIDESFDGWKVHKTPHDYAEYFEDWAIRDVQDMVLRDRNHPSVIMWSIGNEIIERTEPEAVETARMLAQSVKVIDSTRPVTSAMTTWGQGWEIFDPLMAVHDVCGYNYQLHRAPSDHERVPSRIIVNTESYPNNAFNIWELVTGNSYIIGDFVWTAMDYLGESGIGGYYYPGEQGGEHWEGKRFPWHGAYCGDIDLTGWRKPISHYRSMLYNDSEKLYMAVREPNPEDGEIKLTGWAVWPTWESWTWPGHEGKEIEVEVYSRYPSVRLYLNDELVGEKNTGKLEKFKATFTLPYAPGLIRAVGIEEGEEKEVRTMQTAETPSNIRLSADRSEIYASGQDLCYVTIEIIDQKGILDPNASNSIEFNLEGPGEILALDNANLKDTDPYKAKTRNAWNGKALAIIKSTKEPGEITLSVKSRGLEAASITIQSVRGD